MGVFEVETTCFEKGIRAQKEVFEWGAIANFYDPDGNVCQLKDSGTFEAQLLEV